MLILALLFMTLALQNVNFIYLFAAGFCTAFAFITRELTTVALGTRLCSGFMVFIVTSEISGRDDPGMLPLLDFLPGL